MALMKRLVSLRLVVLVGGALLAWGVSVWDGGIGKTDPDIAERPPIAQASPPAPLRDLGTGASPVHGKPAPRASRKRVSRLDRDSGRERRVESEETVRQVGGALLGGSVMFAAFVSWRDRRKLLARLARWRPAVTATALPVYLLGLAALVLTASGLLRFFGRAWLAPLSGPDRFAEIAAQAADAHQYAAVGLVIGALMVLGLTPVARLRSAVDTLRSAMPPAATIAVGVLFAALLLTGMSLTLPFTLPLIHTPHRWAVDLGLASGPAVTLWRDMELTGFAHVASAIAVVAALLIAYARRALWQPSARDMPTQGDQPSVPLGGAVSGRPPLANS